MDRHSTSLESDIERELAGIADTIRRRANRLTIFCFTFWSAIVGAIAVATGGNLDVTAKLATIAAYFMLFGWGCWFIYAYFLRMEKKQDIALRMVMRTNAALPPLKDVMEVISQVKTAIGDVADVISKIRASVDKYEKLANGDALRGAAEELKAVIGNNGVIGKVERHLADIAEMAKTLKPLDYQPPPLTPQPRI
jgi:hypothetical protein